MCGGYGRANSSVIFLISPIVCLPLCTVPDVLAAGGSIARSVGHVKCAYWNPDTSSFVSSLLLP
jgi:hypothetical protein